MTDSLAQLEKLIEAIKWEMEARKSFITSLGLDTEYIAFMNEVYKGELELSPLDVGAIIYEETNEKKYRQSADEVKNRTDNHEVRGFYSEFDKESNVMRYYGVNFKTNQVIELPSQLSALVWCRVAENLGNQITEREFKEVSINRVPGIGRVFFAEKTNDELESSKIVFYGYDSVTGETQTFQDITTTQKWCEEVPDHKPTQTMDLDASSEIKNKQERGQVKNDYPKVR